ncbi:MAG: hypothetical protein Q9221_000742 [Calogaya cf. arnoldii]
MPPFINQSLACQRKIPTVIQGLLGLLDNLTVTPREKAIYLAGLIFIVSCFLGDVVILAYICRKVYRRCRRRRGGGVVHGAGAPAGHEEKGLLVNADDEEEGEQLPAYHDCTDGQRNDNGNVSFDTLKGTRLAPMPYQVPYLGSGDSYSIQGIEESITFPLTWFDFRDRGHLVQSLLDRFKTFSKMRQDLSLDGGNNDDEGTDKENIEPVNREIVANEAVHSPTSKAAHMSPHKACVACDKLAQGNTISSSDVHGNLKESVTFPLTWQDMALHGDLIKWFLESNNPEDFIHKPKHVFDQDNENHWGPCSPNSKAAHLCPHEQCDYCSLLARADMLTTTNTDWSKESVTFPLTMDDLLEHKDLILSHLPHGFKNMEVESAVQFDEDIRH